jgi:hypothetical protein
VTGRVHGAPARSAAARILESPDEQKLLASIWLYVDWYYVTRKLTTDQKEAWADAVDNASWIASDCSEAWEPVADRWWRDV